MPANCGAARGRRCLWKINSLHRAQCAALFFSFSFFFSSFPLNHAHGCCEGWKLFARADNPFDALMRLSFIVVESKSRCFSFPPCSRLRWHCINPQRTVRGAPPPVICRTCFVRWGVRSDWWNWTLKPKISHKLKSVFFFYTSWLWAWLHLLHSMSVNANVHCAWVCIGARFLAYLGRDGAWKQLHAH